MAAAPSRIAETAGGDAPAERPYRWYLLALSATLNGIDKHVVAALAVPLKQAFTSPTPNSG